CNFGSSFDSVSVLGTVIPELKSIFRRSYFPSRLTNFDLLFQ
ncbi:hypothetical protein X975_03637, partial [Stegodyphus mimosarum]